MQVENTSNGTVQTPAFSTYPAGANTSAYSQLGLQVLLQDCPQYPINETFQAALLNAMHSAYDEAQIYHILAYESQSVSLPNQKSSRQLTLLSIAPCNELHDSMPILVSAMQ